ncbi:MAG: hypothetical protein SF097_08900 [Acidobacteriota bacterium]|nr:hypothetical protein [Acidobacteriota bacterium]
MNTAQVALQSLKPIVMPSLFSRPERKSETVIMQGHDIKWAWACRVLESFEGYAIDRDIRRAPKAGDLALVRIEEIGAHYRLVTADNKRLRIFPGDHFVGVFGNRYATDAFEGEVSGLNNLSLLTAGGMIGTVKSKHKDTGKPTKVSFVGFLNDRRGERFNLIERTFVSSFPQKAINNLIVVVGTSMNSGKTTTSTKLIKGLSEKGLRVAACKLTGSVSNRDQDEMRSARPNLVIDFSDYGFPSTYLCSKEELVSLFHTMLAEVEKINPDVIVMEVADGILQRETAMLLDEPSVCDAIKGLLLTAKDGLSALYAIEKLKQTRNKVIAASGAMTSSPLSVREFQANCDVPVGSSADSGKEVVEIVCRFIGQA